MTEGAAGVTEASIGSVSTSVEPPLLGGLEGFEEDEAIPCELSSGEEEEVLWSGGGQLGVPIIPDLPEAVRSKASAAAEVLRGESASEKMWESSAREILDNASRTREILHKPGREHSARVESLAARSSRTGLKGALVDRHVGATRLRPAASLEELAAWGDDSPLVRRASTAPARDAGARRGSRGFDLDGATAAARSVRSTRRDQDRTRLSSGNNGRGGVCVSVEGEIVVGGDGGQVENARGAPTPPPDRPRRAAVGLQASTASGRSFGASPPRSRRRDPFVAGGAAAAASEGSIGGASAASLLDRSLASSSLQASSSGMSARVRARAVATRPTAMRRPFCRWGAGGKIIITDPGQSPEVRHRAATLIQAVMLAMKARRDVQRLRDDRERAALLIGGNWRRYRARLDMWKAKRLRRAEELRQLAVDRLKDRGAHIIQTFCRDFKYRRKRVRYKSTVGAHTGEGGRTRVFVAATPGTLTFEEGRTSPGTEIRTTRITEVVADDIDVAIVGGSSPNSFSFPLGPSLLMCPAAHRLFQNRPKHYTRVVNSPPLLLSSRRQDQMELYLRSRNLEASELREQVRNTKRCNCRKHLPARRTNKVLT